MFPTLARLGGRSAWKGLFTWLTSVILLNRHVIGPFFVHFPKLREAIELNIPIKTQARSCTILPNFVGYVPAYPYCRILVSLMCSQLPVSGP